MNNSQKEMITKKDMSYTIIFLIFLIIVIATLDFGDKQDVVSYVGFAGTIISILLGLIAIIYSFFQTYSSASVSNDLSNYSKDLRISLERAEAENNKFRNQSDEVLKKFDEFSNGLTNLVTTKLDENSNRLLETLSASVKMDSEVSDGGLSSAGGLTLASETSAALTVKRSSNYGAIAMFVVYLVHKNKITFKPSEIFSKIDKTEYLYGYFVALSSAGMFEETRNGEETQIVRLPNSIRAALAVKIASYDNKYVNDAKDAAIIALRELKADLITTLDE